MRESLEDTKKALEAYKSLVNQYCDILVRYLVPDGISEKECIEELFGVLDGPQYRAANKLSPIDPVPKHPLTHGGEK